jgi:hypothetical protein
MIFVISVMYVLNFPSLWFPPLRSKWQNFTSIGVRKKVKKGGAVFLHRRKRIGKPNLLAYQEFFGLWLLVFSLCKNHFWFSESSKNGKRQSRVNPDCLLPISNLAQIKKGKPRMMNFFDFPFFIWWCKCRYNVLKMQIVTLFLRIFLFSRMDFFSCGGRGGEHNIHFVP